MFAPKGFVSLVELRHHFTSLIIRHPKFSEMNEEGKYKPRHDFETRYQWFDSFLIRNKRPIYTFSERYGVVRVSPDVLGRGIINGARTTYFISNDFRILGFRHKRRMLANILWLVMRMAVIPRPKYIMDLSSAYNRFNLINKAAKSIKSLAGCELMVDATAIDELDDFVAEIIECLEGPSRTEKNQIGRPGKVLSCQILYSEIFPRGHSGFTWKQVAETLSKEGEESFSVDTVKRAVGQRN